LLFSYTISGQARVNFDLQTLFATIAIGTALGAVVMFVIARVAPAHAHAATLWGFGNVLQIAGWVLLALRAVLPGLLTIVLANTLLIFSFAFYYKAIRSFDEERANLVLPYLAVATILVGLTYYTFASYSFVARTVIVGAHTAALSLYCAAALLWRRWRPFQWSRSVTAGGFLVIAVVFSGRAAYFAFTPNPPQTLFEPHVWQDITYVATFIVVFVIPFGFLLMINERLNSDLERLAVKDGLTEIYNRRTILEIAGRVHAAMQRAGGDMALLMIDLDQFKEVNDSMGHLAGDRALKLVVATMTARLRSEDSIGRYGGEEFLVVLPHAMLAGAEALAEDIRAEVEAAHFEIGDQEVRLTVSIGAASGPVDGGLEAMIHNADLALLAAKRAGRNRVVPFSKELSQNGN
jgi:diguanylate cyclase (GGDEF)-like protein